MFFLHPDRLLPSVAGATRRTTHYLTRPVARSAFSAGGAFGFARWAFVAAVFATPAAWADPADADAPVAYDVQVDYDVSFATHDDQPLYCDVYRPRRAGSADADIGYNRRAAGEDDAAEVGAAARADQDGALVPVMIVVHGGGWTIGDKWMSAGYARAFAEAGIAAVVINYRLAPEHKFPAQLDDLRAAMLWTEQVAESYGWDASRLGLFGYSAGAHLCLLVGTLADEPLATQQQTSNWPEDDPRWQALPRVELIVAGGAPCDFRSLPPQNRTLAYFLGGSPEEMPDVYRFASPASHVSAGDVPTFYYHGSRDLIVPMQASRTMCDRQIEAGVESSYLKVDGQGHLFSFQHPLAKQASLEFVRERLLESSDR